MRVLRFSVGDKIHYGVMQSDSNQVVAIKGDPMYSEVEPSGQVFDFSEIRLLSPVIPRSKVICLELPATAFESQSHLDFYLKPNTSVVGPDDPIVIPDWAESIAGRTRLAAVIKTMCKDLSSETVDDAIFGWTIVNDVVAFMPDGKKRNLASHGFDSSCPVGPWIVVNPELSVNDLEYTESINGQQITPPAKSVLPLSPREAIIEASRLTTLLPGDLVVAGCLSDWVSVQANDRMECSISDLGTLTNPVLSR